MSAVGLHHPSSGLGITSSVHGGICGVLDGDWSCDTLIYKPYFTLCYHDMVSECTFDANE